jgi:ribonucleoside-triphosphate reductase
MHEACLNFLGEGIATDNGKAFAEEVMDYMRARLVRYQEESGDIFNLEATPAEGTAYRLALLDRKQFPGIITATESGEPFYTNSSQLPVDFTDDVFELLDRQDSLQARYTGGTVQHLFIGERIVDTAALKSLVRKICSGYHLPYFSITPTFSICPACGYLDGEVPACPQCRSTTEVYSRVVGYLRPVQQWNEGKQQEFRMRKTLTL